ncbi:MAG: hypothetical protein PUJ78_03360 [Coriobacteriaceae bacterium]|nr:hypothetical protein [Coriobacteriaceae bacterium]
MKIAVAQMRTTAGELQRTAERMVELARRAAGEGAQLVVFPAAALMGVWPVDPPSQEGLLLDLAEALVKISEEAPCPCIVPVLSDADGAPAPEAILVHDGQLTPLKLSALLRSSVAGHAGRRPEAGREDGDGPAPDLPIFELGGVHFGLAFSFDDLNDFDDYAFDIDVVLYLDGYGFAMDDPSSAMGVSVSDGRFMDDAEATGAWVVGVGSLGTYGMQVFTGSSFVLTPWGELAAQAPSLEEGLLMADIDPDRGSPLDHPLDPEVYDRPLVAWNALAQGLAESLSQMGFTQAAVLVDGTLGSCAVATLATDALGPTNVHALLATGANDGLDAAARRLAENLRLPVRELPMSALSPDRTLAADLAQAHLVALAREEGAMPLSNLDKTALALEASPGSMPHAGLAPLGDVYRSAVIELVHMRNTISPVISRASRHAFEVPAIPGIEECGPTPESRIDFVDYVLASHVEWGRALSDIADDGGHPQVVSDILDRLASCAPGRMACGPVIVSSSRTLDDVAWPLGMAWRDRVRTKAERAGEGIGGAISLGDDLDEAIAQAAEGLRGVAGPQKAGDAQPAGGEPDAPAAPRDREGDVRDVLNILRDLSLTGGLAADQSEGRADRHGQGGRPGPGGVPGDSPIWRTFSEN